MQCRVHNYYHPHRKQILRNVFVFILQEGEFGYPIVDET